MKIIIGLGNPGIKYENTRHNAGFWVLDYYAHINGVDINKAKFNSLIGEFYKNGEKIILVKPMTFMNNSGLAVREVIDYFKPNLEDVLVVVDDIEINLGYLRIRKTANKGTHNGLRSIFSHIHTDDYAKMKVGVGKYKRDIDLAQFVLQNPTKEENAVIDDTIERASKALDVFIEKGIDFAMNNYNGGPA